MRILFEYTKRILMKNRARTLVTIAGIVLSFALFTAVLTGGASGIKFYVDVMKDVYGNWHGAVYHVNDEQIKQLENMSGVTDIFSMEIQEVANKLPEDLSETKPYTVIGGVDENFLTDINIVLVDGRFPEQEGEIIVPNNLYQTNVRVDTGDVVTLEVGQREDLNGNEIYHNNPYNGQNETFVVTGEKTYTVVGVYESKNINLLSACKYFYTVKGTSHLVDVFFRSSELKTLETTLSQNFPTNETIININLLRYMGYDTSEHSINVYDMLYAFIFILCCMVIFVSVSLIYNSFAISLGERTKQFGLLKSIGATKPQIRWIVIIEAGLLCIISIPIGLLLGCGSVWIVLNCLKEQFETLTNSVTTTTEIVFYTKPMYLVVATLFGIITVMISAWIPAIRVNAMTPVEAIRQSKDVKISARQVKGGVLWTKVLGVSGMLAYKNAKRNKKPYRSIVVSIASSLILFLVGGGLVVYMNYFLQYELNNTDYDFLIFYPNQLSRKEQEAVGAYLNEQDSIDDFVLVHTEMLYLDYQKADELTEVGQIYAENQGHLALKQNNLSNLNAYFIDDASFLSLLEEQGLNSKIFFEKHIKGLLINSITSTTWDYNTEKWMPYGGSLYKNDNHALDFSICTVKNIEGCTSFYMTPTGFGFYMSDGEIIEHSLAEARHDVDISIGAVLSKEDVPGYVFLTHPSIILPMKALTELDFGMLSNVDVSYLYVYTSQNDLAGESLVAMQRNKNLPSYVGFNDIGSAGKVTSAMLDIINVFLMCFVVVLCIIAVANVTNTIATSVRLRKREYAMLQSIGIGTKSMYRYILFENLSYTIKAGVIGFGIGVAINYMTLNFMRDTLMVNFFLPTTYYLIALVALIVLVCFSVMYTHYKTKGTHICDELRNEVW